jgi:hypothetical protein
MTQQYPYDRRWYDNLPNLSRAVSVSRELPNVAREIVAKHLSQQIDHHRQQQRAMPHPVSLGGIRVLGLHKASYRRRWYDRDGGLARAYNLMSTMPDTFLDEFAARVLQVSIWMDHHQEPVTAGWEQQQYLPAMETVDGILTNSLVAFKNEDNGLRLVASGWPSLSDPGHSSARNRHWVRRRYPR